MEKLVCPFCGGEVKIVVCDDEGNLHDEEYEKNPWSGLGYQLYHDVTDVPDGKKCPIAGHEYEGIIGRVRIYDSREDAAAVWLNVDVNSVKHKYLDELGVAPEFRMDCCTPAGDEREVQWAQERKEFGFDSRETWALELSFYCWLYERLKMFLDVNCIDLTFHKFEYEGEELTQQECIDRMLEGLKIALFKEDYHQTDEERKKVSDIAKIWAIVLPAMWW